MPQFRAKAATLLIDARAAHITSTERIAVLEAERQQKLLADDDAALDALDAELETVRKAARRQAERIKLLEGQAEREEAVALEARRENLLDRVEKILNDADTTADELQKTLARADRLFRKVIKLRQEAAVALPLTGDPDVGAVAVNWQGWALSAGAVLVLLKFELYRIGARPVQTGGAPAGYGTEVSFPGGLSPRIDLQLQPEKIKPLADALREASAFAIQQMRDQFANRLILVEATPAQPAAPPPSPPVEPVAAAPQQEITVQSPPPEQPPAEQAPLPPLQTNGKPMTFGELLLAQAAAASDMSPAGERRYEQIVAEIAARSAGA